MIYDDGCFVYTLGNIQFKIEENSKWKTIETSRPFRTAPHKPLEYNNRPTQTNPCLTTLVLSSVMESDLFCRYVTSFHRHIQ